MGWPGAAGSGQSPRGPGAAKLRLTQQLCRDAESSVGMLTNEAAPEGQLLPPPAALRQPGGASICHPWGGQSRSRQLCFPLRLLSPAQRDGISVDPDPAGPAPRSLQPTALWSPVLSTAGLLEELAPAEAGQPAVSQRSPALLEPTCSCPAQGGAVAAELRAGGLGKARPGLETQ